MEKIIANDQIHALVTLPKNFDLDLIDQSAGFTSKIFPFVSRAQFEALALTHPNIHQALAKAGILYALVLDIPRIKVYISNFGINQYQHDKARVAPWWDVRDLGLSWLKKANDTLYQALALIGEEPMLKQDNLFFSQQLALVDVFQFQQFYHLGNSVEVYMRLSAMMKEALELLLLSLGGCTLNELLNNAQLSDWLRKYLMNGALATASASSTLLFLTTGLAIQYEELPWQKSVVLSPEVVQRMGAQYQHKADMYLQLLLKYLQDHADEFPCYQPKEVQFRTKIIAKDSGLFL